jgi:hypothetical protein
MRSVILAICARACRGKDFFEKYARHQHRLKSDILEKSTCLFCESWEIKGSTKAGAFYPLEFYLVGFYLLGRWLCRLEWLRFPYLIEFSDFFRNYPGLSFQIMINLRTFSVFELQIWTKS